MSSSTTNRIWRTLEGSISGLVSVVLHMSLLLFIALMSYGDTGLEGEGTEVQIGILPAENLTQVSEPELKADEVRSEPRSAVEELEIPSEVSPSEKTTTTSADTLAITSPSAGLGNGGSFDLGNVGISSSGGGGCWDGLIQTLRRNGFDIVITFDSTGSMSGEINEVKRRIERIGSTLLKLVPKARISICTYRDRGDDYVAKGLPLTSDLQAIEAYLKQISAGGGGDHPEAVHEGLRWAVEYNAFRPHARKVILIFGDAPPHASDMKTCLRIAGDFSAQQKGVVSTVTCRDPARMQEFIDIASAGGGESFLSSDERQLMTQLLVLAFGSQHRSKVLEAFKLLER